MDAAQYLAAERTSTIKHELWRGEVFAMAGASYGPLALAAIYIESGVESGI